MAVISARDRRPKLGVFVLLREPEAPPSRRWLAGYHLPKLGVFAQLVQSESYAPLHGTRRQAETLCYLLVRQIREVSELEDLLLDVRHSIECFAHPTQAGLVPDLGESLAWLVPGCICLYLLLHPAAGRFGAQLVYALVADHREDPGPDATPLWPVSVSRAPDLEEGVLGQVLCGVLLTGQLVGNRVGAAAMALVEAGEGIGIAPTHEHHQVLVREVWVAYLVIPS